MHVCAHTHTHSLHIIIQIHALHMHANTKNIVYASK